MAGYLVERLDKNRHDRSKFDCGEELLNRYLRQLSGQHSKSGISKTYAAIVLPDKRVVGYYSLSMGQIDCEGASKSLLPKPPKGLLLPCTLIGRLAVDRTRIGRISSDERFC
jgi:hypothetical protein